MSKPNIPAMAYGAKPGGISGTDDSGGIVPAHKWLALLNTIAPSIQTVFFIFTSL